jgi:hypothetical protein
MNKKEIRNAINKSVYIYAESLGYTTSDDNDGSYVTFSKGFSNSDNTIDYGRSSHSACCLNWASDEVKADTDKINKFAENQMRMYEK